MEFAMEKPMYRTTEIFQSKTIEGLFYEGFKKSEGEKLNNDDLIIAFHYNGKRFDLQEFVRIKPEFDTDFKEVEGEDLMGRIVGIEPENEGGVQNLIIRVEDCESCEEDLFMVTEIKKEKD